TLLTIFLPILKLISVFDPKLKLGLEGRKNWKSAIEKIPKDKPIIWFHCASLGEFDQGLPIMNLIKSKNPSFQIVVTFFSPSGYLHYQKRKNPVDFAFYLPFDTRSNAKEFLSLLNPRIGFFVKYEFWLNILNEAKNKGIPIFSVATILRPNQIYFKWFGGLFRKALKNVSYFFVQNKETTQLLNHLGIRNYEIIGDTRFDRVLENKILFEKSKSNVEFDIFERFLGNDKAIIFGSSWSQEEQILFSYIAENKAQKVILAPHNVSETNIVFLQQKLKKTAVRFTSFENDYLNQQVLILDTIGHLSTAYSYGKVAFVGGGFSGSLHNILEPAVFGLPVFFGPKHDKFPEATEFINQGIGFEIENYQEFILKLNVIQPKLEELSKRTIEFVESQRGASEKILENQEVKNLLN
ncbi:MAG: 3-deoxy-D-manno-octulosonic acid transferase, partial [Bacteroidota bacterium]